MNLLENLLIIAGIGLDVFAAFEIQGAMLASVKKKSLIIACGVVAGLELLFYFGGYAACRLLDKFGYIADPGVYGDEIAMVVLSLVGIRLIIKAVKREFVNEKRKEKILVLEYIRILLVSCCYTLAAGCVSGLMGVTIWQLIVIIFIISVLMVIGGVYTGLHFGFENKTQAYVIGAILLWAAALEILLTKVLGLF